MKNRESGVKGWQQLSMFGGGPLELTLRIGCFPEADHAQFQLELRTAGAQELLSMASRPHVDWRDAEAELESWFAAVRLMLEEIDEPFH